MKDRPNGQTSQIREITPGAYSPFEYPSPGGVPHYPEEQLLGTERWVENTLAGGARLFTYKRNKDELSRKRYLSWITTLVQEEGEKVEALFKSMPLRPPDPLSFGTWQLQNNEGGMQTCQLVSATNALNFLYPRNPQPYTERDMLKALGGQHFAAANQDGIEASEIARALKSLAGHVDARRTNSVAEMIRAAEEGAAVMFPISNNHEALMPPGHRIGRNNNGQLYVLAADPMSEQSREVPVSALIRSEIIVVSDPNLVENNVLIIEKGIREVAQRPANRTVKNPIRTVSNKPDIRTLHR